MLAFVGLLIFPSANAYFTLVSGQPIAEIQVISQNLTLAYGPILYLTIQQILLRPLEFKKYSWHFLPFIILLIDQLSNSSIFSGQLLVIVIFTQVLTYLAWTCHTLRNNKYQILKLTQQHKNTSYYWLLFLALGLSITMIIDLSVWTYILTLNKLPSLLLLSITASILSLYSNMIAFFALFQPKVFLHDVSLNNDKPVATITAAKDPKPNPIRRVELSPEAANLLDQKLQALIQEHKPHLDETISLGKLASLLGINRNQLSELLNIHKQTTFYDLLNDLRHQESLSLLNDPNINLSAIDIAYRSGFNNRNSFYTTFKKRTGMTPAQYKKQLKTSA